MNDKPFFQNNRRKFIRHKHTVAHLVGPIDVFTGQGGQVKLVLAGSRWQLQVDLPHVTL